MFDGGNVRPGGDADPSPPSSAVVKKRVALYLYYIFDLDTRRGWGVSATSRSHLTPMIDPVPIVQEAGWASGPVWIFADYICIYATDRKGGYVTRKLKRDLESTKRCERWNIKSIKIEFRPTISHVEMDRQSPFLHCKNWIFPLLTKSNMSV